MQSRPSNDTVAGNHSARQITDTLANPGRNSQLDTPTIELPKGGGAIRGIGEKFGANPVNGTGSMSIPLALSPGRDGFSPQLSLTYDSGSGNGVFGFGWSLSISSITRKTDKGLPTYRDQGESDTFILSGAEDLVPELNDDFVAETLLTEDKQFEIHRYRPRIEGLFARIERWVDKTSGDTHWRSITPDNILSIYGKDKGSRIAEPQNPKRIFSWLICETRDDKGNAILYEYKSEDGAGVDLGRAYERNRGGANDPRRTANRYLKRVIYGNEKPLLEAGRRPRFLSQNKIDNTDWMFELVFDYGEHDVDIPKSGDSSAWKLRDDAFSNYRAGFDLRTTRLCHRVLMFHHFADESAVGKDCLVRSTDFRYSHQAGESENLINPSIYTFLLAVTQSGYKRKGGRFDNGYIKRNLPPVEFEYSQPTVEDHVEEIDLQSLENLPPGVDDADYRWIDLHNEGTPGILTEQGNSWWYKRNISPINNEVKFSRLEQVTNKPNLSLRAGAQFMDIEGNGQLDLALLENSAAGFFEHDNDEGWQSFKAFESSLNHDFKNPNLKFIDLDGDGLADILVSEENAFVWHASLLNSGFGPAQRVAQSLDEETGPRLVFNDGAQSIFLADMSGDGLTDLVRIRCSEICYWPNLGYCRFGAKVAMANAPRLDHPDNFAENRIRLADIDGSGTIDIIYLGSGGVNLYFNQSGNSWSDAQALNVHPKVNEIVNISTADLLGNGTACLVWSSPLPDDAPLRMRYVNLMGKQKPHLLVKTNNNLGAVTQVSYAPSTKFYLTDKLAGKPWVTKLPFPVQVVEKVVVTDKWRKTHFATSYSYHHGYFDGVEREFRGFGRVEQVDVENYGTFLAGNADSPYISDDQTLYQPPIKTVTWFHTGAAGDRPRVLSQFEQEYFEPPGSFSEQPLPEPELPDSLDAGEWREAMRACKGMQLRQEIYELDVEALTNNQHQLTHLYSSSYQNCNIQLLQKKSINQYAVFLVTPSQVINYQYDFDLSDNDSEPDPRISHTLNLKTDELGNAVQTASVTYPRLGRHIDASLDKRAQTLIQQVQNELHIAYAETRFTNDINSLIDFDHYRLRQPCETLNYELKGIESIALQFSLEELQALQLSKVYQTSGSEPVELEYHQLANQNDFTKRIVEHSRILYFADDLQQPLPFGQLNALGLPFETYTLALTEQLLSAVFDDKLDSQAKAARLNDANQSGYLNGPELEARFVGSQGQYWLRSGIAGFTADAAEHFFLPEKFTDSFGNSTLLEYDARDLFIRSSVDALGNQTTVEQFDYRVLAPSEIKDINDNLSELVFDTLGFVAATAVKGKSNQADNLSGFDDSLIDPELAVRISFFTQSYSQDNARAHLGNATARQLYDFGEVQQADGSISYAHRPASAAAITREQHAAGPKGATSPLQAAFEYSDGSGNVLLTKNQAEPENGSTERRWIANGKTILNNKGNPVKQYEPYFTESHTYQEPVEIGVTPILYYDAADRLIRTELPDGSLQRIEFSPWHAASFDANDTAFHPELAKQSDWHRRRTDLAHPRFSEFNTTEHKRAAERTAEHSGTPAITYLDSLGRDVISIEHNRVKDDQGVLQDQKNLTFTKLDAEGKPLWIRDARGNLVMQYITPAKPDSAVNEPNQNDIENIPANTNACYSIAGELLFQHSMDGGDRWMIHDAAGQPFIAWDENESEKGIFERRLYNTVYDALRRPTEQHLQINNDNPLVIERLNYGEGLAASKQRNLHGQLHQHFDSSGLMANTEFDFKGNLLRAERQLATFTTDSLIDWPENPAPNSLQEVYVQKTEYDALDRMQRHENWHRVGRQPAVYKPQYNQRGLLVSETLSVRGQDTTAIQNIEHNAKGQRMRIQYGNGTTTRYFYDAETFRLVQLRTTKSSPGDALPIAPSNLSNANVLQNLYYHYDPVGNITEIRDDAYEPVFFNNQQVEPRSRYRYDSLYRLIEASGRENFNAPPNASKAGKLTDVPGKTFPITEQALRNYSQHYRYDSVGNIQQMRHVAEQGSWTRHYEYAADSNRLLKTWQGTDKINATVYQYDTHGSMLNLNNTVDEFKLSFDSNDMIQHINLGGGGDAFYHYGSDKERSRKHIVRNNGEVEERIYLGGMEVFKKFDANGVIVEEIESHHLFDGEQRVLMVEDVFMGGSSSLPDNTTLFKYQYSNHLGSVGLELDEHGAVLSYEEYHPYGTTAFSANNSVVKATKKRYRYTGMERDEESGLSYHSARYYLPWLGRWGSVDPIGVDGGSNLYKYTKNNPIVLIDIDGLKPKRRIPWQVWVKKFRDKYPKYEGYGAVSGTHDAGLMTKSGIRVPIHEGNLLQPRDAYRSENAALMAYQGYVHYAELIESGHMGSAGKEARSQQGRDGQVAPNDNMLDPVKYTKHVYGMAGARDLALTLISIGKPRETPSPSRGSVNDVPTNSASGTITGNATRGSVNGVGKNAASGTITTPAWRGSVNGVATDSTSGIVVRIVDAPGVARSNAYVGKAQVGYFEWDFRGVVSINLNIPKNLQKEGIGSKIFAEAVGDANQISALWVENSSLYKATTVTPGVSNNLSQYRKAIKDGLSPKDAAWSTWTGREASKNGFTSVSVKNADYGVGISATFSK